MRVIENQLSEIEVQVSDFLRINCSVQWGVIYAGAYKEHNGQKWEHDKWSFTFTRTGVKKSINFEYHTGIGHRELPKVNGREIKPKFWDNVQSTRELALWKESNLCPVKPGPAGIIYSLIMDGRACHQSFADWCGDFGYDVDSRKALTMYEACQKEYDKLRSMCTAAEIAQLQILLEGY